MFHFLGRMAATHAWVVCFFWVWAGVGLTLAAPAWDTRTQDDDVRFVPDRFTSVRAYQLMEEAFPQDVFASSVVFAIERNEGQLTETDFRAVDRIVACLEKVRRDQPDLRIGRIHSYADSVIGYRLISSDRQCTLLQVHLGTPYLAMATRQAVDQLEDSLRDLTKEEAFSGLRIHTTGAAGVGRDLIRTCGDSLDATTWATVLLVIVVLLGVYRAPVLALIPLISIGISVWVSLNLLALMTLIPGVHLVNISKIFAIVILYGAGTDYCLFLISRYREELENGFTIREALARSVGGVGEALAASAGTVMVGLGLMGFAEFAKVRYAGPAIALSLGVALVASLTLTPALLRILGHVVFWPGKPPVAVLAPRLLNEDVRRSLLWERLSDWVATRPVLVWLGSMAVLVPLILVGVQVQPSYRATSELHANAPSVKGLDVLQTHFTAGAIGPTTVLLVSEKDWNTTEGRLDIEHLSRGFAALPNVAEVRSLTQPLGFNVPELPIVAETGNPIVEFLAWLQPMVHQFRTDLMHGAKQHYLANVTDEETGKKRFVCRLDVVFETDPFDPASVEALGLIQTWLKYELPQTSFLGSIVQAECYGVTATSQDLATVTESDRHRVNGFVLVAILAILLVLVRSIWLAIYLLVTVLASYYAALGATVLAGFFWTGAILPSVDWRVPFFLFTILVAVGEDYNILLVCRALEERRRFGAVEGMRRALAKTGGAITSCGLIMAGTFATLMLAGLNTLMQIGFALAFGVLIDTFIVRPFLVPACAILFWKTSNEANGEDETGPKSNVQAA